MKTVNIIDGICIALFIFMGVYMFALPGGMQDLLMPLFSIINPFKTGAWIMGIGFLVTCIWGRGKTGILLGVVLLGCYLITAAISIVGLIVLTSGWDLLWYLHPVLIILAGIIALTKMIKKRTYSNM